MRNAILISDDAHTLAWMRQRTGELDLTVTTAGVADISATLLSGSYHVAIIDAGREPEPFVQLGERLAADGVDTKLLLIVEAEALPGLRLPVRVSADFMVRGGSSEELAARIRTLLWPGEEASAQEIVRIDDLTVNLATYQAYIGNEAIEFTYLEYALFVFLLTHPNRVYSREVLLKRVWETDFYGGSRTVDVHVRRVRSKLGPELSSRLETVRNVGYMWQM